MPQNRNPCLRARCCKMRLSRWCRCEGWGFSQGKIPPSGGKRLYLPIAGKPVDGAVGPVVGPAAILDEGIIRLRPNGQDEHRLGNVILLQHIALPPRHVGKELGPVGIVPLPLGGVPAGCHNGLSRCTMAMMASRSFGVASRMDISALLFYFWYVYSSRNTRSVWPGLPPASSRRISGRP